MENLNTQKMVGNKHYLQNNVLQKDPNEIIDINYNIFVMSILEVQTSTFDFVPNILIMLTKNGHWKKTTNSLKIRS